jgi:hypothetical protein
MFSKTITWLPIVETWDLCEGSSSWIGRACCWLIKYPAHFTLT